ncbi:MAG: DUF1045 domain-containing protein [Paracoccaceae bacterium]
MSEFIRYAIYYLPASGPLATFGAHWLGWDVQNGRPVVQLPVAGLEQATRRPRKYGFHATLKPPFALAQGVTPEELLDRAETLSHHYAPIALAGLSVRQIGRFLALCPNTISPSLQALAASCVTALDPLRAPMSEDEFHRRRSPHLTDRQDALLRTWGYPHVLGEYRFHMTLTGPLDAATRQTIQAALDETLPPLGDVHILDRISVVGEAPNGQFHHIATHPLRGADAAHMVA